MIDKRVTENFRRYDKQSGIYDKDFAIWRSDLESTGARVVYDRRNNIYCAHPTMDWEMYYNYCVYLNESYSDWVNYGYFDMGMVPYLMWPSFMDQSEALEYMRKVAVSAGVELIKVPAVSFLKNAYVSNGTDYWMFRDDMFKLCEILRSVDPGLYPYTFSSPREVCLSGFLKPLVDISNLKRGVYVHN